MQSPALTTLFAETISVLHRKRTKNTDVSTHSAVTFSAQRICTFEPSLYRQCGSLLVLSAVAPATPTPMPAVRPTNRSIPTHSLPSERPTKRRTRKRTPPSDSDSEQVHAYVLASGKFKCSDPECEDLRFGRQADFKRHFTNTHADRVLEFFCPIRGCERSKNPVKRSKGRSFGGRKDKMQEHVQTVHHKLSTKRKLHDSATEEEDEDADEADESQPKARHL